MERGALRVYLGAAPGVGKTYAMLAEGLRRAERGTDVVVAFVETHGRAKTEAAIAGLEVVPRREVDHSRPAGRRAGPGRGAGPAARGGPGRRAGPHQRRRPARVRGSHQALAGRGDAAGRRDRRDHHGEHPAPGVAQRRGRLDHRYPPARDGARRGGAGGGHDRAGGHESAGPAAADGPRQRLRRGQDRRGPGQLLPGGQPRGPARARPAVVGRPGRCRARALPRAAPDRRQLADPRAGRGRGVRRPGVVGPDAAGRPDRVADGGWGVAGRVRQPPRRADRGRARRAGAAAGGGRGDGRRLPGRRGPRLRGRAAGRGPRRQRQPGADRRQPAGSAVHGAAARRGRGGDRPLG